MNAIFVFSYFSVTLIFEREDKKTLNISCIFRKNSLKDKVKRPARFLDPYYVPIFLTNGEFKKFVQLPKYLPEIDWLVDHGKYYSLQFKFNIYCVAFDFFHNINLYQSTIADYCTCQSCPVLYCGVK